VLKNTIREAPKLKAIQLVLSVGRWFERVAEVRIPAETLYGVRTRQSW